MYRLYNKIYKWDNIEHCYKVVYKGKDAKIIFKRMRKYL